MSSVVYHPSISPSGCLLLMMILHALRRQMVLSRGALKVSMRHNSEHSHRQTEAQTSTRTEKEREEPRLKAIPSPSLSIHSSVILLSLALSPHSLRNPRGQSACPARCLVSSLFAVSPVSCRGRPPLLALLTLFPSLTHDRSLSLSLTRHPCIPLNNHPPGPPQGRPLNFLDSPCWASSSAGVAATESGTSRW